jgi:membrane protein
LRLREFTRLGFEESESLLQRMLEVGWVGRVKSEVTTSWRLSRKHRKQDRWVLLANPEKLTVSDVYQLFAFAPSAQSPLSFKVEEAVERELATPLKNYFNDPLANSNNASST